MAIVTGSILAYVSSSRERWSACTDPIVRLVVDPRYKTLLVLIVLITPMLVAFNVYLRMNVPLEAPGFGRTIHPAPPDSITVHEVEVDLIAGDNPHRELEHDDPEAFAEHLENGRRVYFENCFYCHGDAMAGDGMFAHGLNPIPSNFTDQGVLPMFQESFFFWRISKGGPGLPEEGGPWDTAMPAWENFLTDDEMWDVILFLYDYTGYEPRAKGEHAE
jgi:mono/diheme cytochrome c family protein